MAGNIVLSAEQMDHIYRDTDPFHYQTDPEDIKRKRWTLQTINAVKELYGLTFHHALDIGCGEGWITKELPAKKIYGMEMSAEARLRLPPEVKPLMIPVGLYDLVLASGVLYEHYDWRRIVGLIRKHAGRIVVLGHIAGDEVKEAIQNFPGHQIVQTKFPYKDWIWKIRVFDRTVL